MAQGQLGFRRPEVEEVSLLVMGGRVENLFDCRVGILRRGRLVELMPELKNYEYAMVTNQVLLVDPKSKQVVEIIN